MSDSTHTPPPDPTTKLAIVELPESAQVVGAVMRPPRILTAGRRWTDRWIAFGMGCLLTVASFFLVYLGVRNYQLSEQLREPRVCVTEPR